MKRFIISLFIILSISLVVLFFPRKVINGIVLETNTNYSVLYVNQKVKKIKVKNLDFPKYTVVNFKFNLIKAYDITVVKPISNRILLKNKKNYEFEDMGKINLSHDCSFYKIDENNNIALATSKDLIVGKNNIKSFLYKNNLKTFLIYPLKDYSTIRVGISTSDFSSVYHKELHAKFDNAATIYDPEKNISLDIPKSSNVKITYEKNKIHVYTEKKHLESSNRLYIKEANIKITNLTRGFPRFDPNYKGTIELYPSNKGVILINEINLEDYLCKVVPSEMPVWGGIEALKCQSVAARTYAISDMMSDRYGNLGFHVDDSTRCQVYNNIQTENISTKAVHDTSGLIMTYNKLPIDAKYYSTSAGTGVNYEDIWFQSDGSSDVKPYLRTNVFLKNSSSIPLTEKEWLDFYKNKKIKSYDSNSSYFRWQVTLDKKPFEKNLNNNLKKIWKNSREYITIYKKNKKVKSFPRKLGDLKNIQVLSRSAGGNILEISFIFENNTVNIKKDSYIRRVFKCDPPMPKISLLNNKSMDNWSSLPSSFFSLEINRDAITIYGGGYGHGVGMSQYGAIYLGKEKLDFKSILNTYYNDIEFTKIY